MKLNLCDNLMDLKRDEKDANTDVRMADVHEVGTMVML